VAAKFKTAQTVEWKVPGALAGNEVPSWVDNSGSINRRIVLFEFPKRVHDGDMELGRKIDREMPAILRKCNKAYLEAVHR
jgi:phage/plasmid-associated DNA primase